MKQIFTLLLIVSVLCGCRHPDPEKGDLMQVTVEANVGDLLKQYMLPGDSIANATIAATYKEYDQQQLSFLSLYFNKLAKVDPVNAPGHHFKAAGLNPVATASECITFFDRKLEKTMHDISVIYTKRLRTDSTHIRHGNKAEQLIVNEYGEDSPRFLEYMQEKMESNGNLAFFESYTYSEVYPLLKELNASLEKEISAEKPVGETGTQTDTTTQKKTAGTLREQLAEKKKQEEEQTARATPKLKRDFSLIAISNYEDDETDRKMLAFIGHTAIEDTALVDNYLGRIPKKLNDGYLKFLWMPDAANKIFTLYAAKTDGAGKALLSGSIIEKAKEFHDQKKDGAPYVSMKFTKEAAATWSKMTRNNVGKCIVIAIDGLVCCAPKVEQEMKGDFCSITGGFTVSGADDLANLLNSGCLPVRVKITGHKNAEQASN